MYPKKQKFHPIYDRAPASPWQPIHAPVMERRYPHGSNPRFEGLTSGQLQDLIDRYAELLEAELLEVGASPVPTWLLAPTLNRLASAHHAAVQAEREQGGES